jgi:hypothetical protein
VIIPDKVKSIGYSTFWGCSGLTSVTIPKGVAEIREGAFSGCSGLTSISVEDGNKVYDSRDNCNAIIETVTNTLIAGCKNTVIPNSVTNIGGYVFYCCHGLTSVTIPNSVKSIGNSAFYGCDSLEDVYCYAESVPITDCCAFGYSPILSATLHVPAASVEVYKVAMPWCRFKAIVPIK